MSIERLVDNYESICAQIKNHRAEIALLMKRKATVEQEIISVLKRMDTDGITAGGKEVFIESKIQKARMGKKLKENEYARVLRENGVANPHAILTALNEVGETHEKTSVKMRGAVKRR